MLGHTVGAGRCSNGSCPFKGSNFYVSTLRRRAHGECLSRRCLSGLVGAIFTGGPERITEQLFLFSCFYCKVDFVSVTCLGHSGVGSRKKKGCLICGHRGARRDGGTEFVEVPLAGRLYLLLR